MSLGISFSQYNCANSAGGGVGFMGGVIQIGGGMESDPCNARANASAFYQIAQTLATTNPALSAQLFHAAILLIGNSTKSTVAALETAGVTDWVKTDGSTPLTIVPPGAPATPSTAPTAPLMPPNKPPAESPPASVSPRAETAVAEDVQTVPVSDSLVAGRLLPEDDDTIVRTSKNVSVPTTGRAKVAKKPRELPPILATASTK
jgi:hypothetical protein